MTDEEGQPWQVPHPIQDSRGRGPLERSTKQISVERPERTGWSEHNSKSAQMSQDDRDGKTMVGQSGHDSQVRITGTGPKDQATLKGQLYQDSQNRSTGTVQPSRSALTGQVNQNKKKVISLCM
jgi:hypothetical protein